MTFSAVPRLVSFDLDGTLVDSAPDVLLGINSMQRALQGPQRTLQQIRHWTGNGVERTVHRAVTGDFEADAEVELFTEALVLFRSAYSEFNGQAAVLYPGVRKTLDILRRKDIALACITNKATEFTAPLLKTLAIDHYFKIVLSGDTLPRCKPYPDQLLRAAEWADVHTDHCVHVGDSVSDIRAAQAASTGVVYVTYGYNQGLSIQTIASDYAPDVIISSMTQLLHCWPNPAH